MRNIRHVGAAVLALGVALAAPARAQEITTGSLAGVVHDEQGAVVPGASVTLVSEHGTRTLVTDAQGRFFAPFLKPGRYAARVELTGFVSVEQKGIDVRLGARLELSPLTLKVGAEEQIEVVASAPVVDTSSTTAGGVLDAETLKRLPVGRNFTEALYLVPGVSDSSGVGRANPSIAGASGLDNNYVVDGVNISNAGFGGVGSYSIVFGSLGTGVTSDFVKETQVKTAGFEAEYGQATGGVVNVVTQSGTNVLHGALYGYFRPYALTSGFEQLQTPNGTVNQTGDANFDFGVSLGGPLVKDKLFFFGAFNPQFQNRKFVAPAGFPLASLGEVEQKRRIDSYAGKLSWQASPNHHLDVSVFGDPSHGANGPQRQTALLGTDTSSFSELETYGGHQQGLRYDGVVNPRWLVEASIARSENTINEIPAVDTWRVTDRTVVPNVVTGGIGFYDKGGVGENVQYALKSTHIFDAAGSHQVRYGAQYEDISFTRDQTRTGPTFRLANGVQTSTGAQVSILPDPVYGRIFRVTRANYGDTPKTVARYLSFFAQDTWQVGKRLTLRPGLRWERQRLVGGSPLCFANDSQPGAGDGSGTPINCEYTFDNNWSPRLGATYDLLGNGKSKLYASFGRFYSKIPNDLAARALSANAGVTRADYFDAELTQPIPDGVVAGGQTQHLLTAGAGAALVDPNAKSTYTQEWLGGAEFELSRALNLGVRYVHRSLPQVLEDVGTLSLTGYLTPGAPTAGVSYFITNIDGDVPTQCLPGYACSFETPVHAYDALEVTLNKSFSDNWGLVASYRWSRLKGNFEGFFRSDNGQSDPSITSLFDFPTDDPSYAAVGGALLGFRGDIRYLGDTLGSGTLPNDRPHQLKLYGTYAWRGMNLGLGFNAGSGRALTALAANPYYTNNGEIPEGVRGSGIETAGVAGCDACGGARARSPFETTIDLHADYALRLGRQRVVLLADVFNLLDDQDPTNYDTYTESSFGSRNPNYGFPTNGGAGVLTGYQAPRQVRLGARLEW